MTFMPFTSLVIQSSPIPIVEIPDHPGPIELKLPKKLNDDEFFSFCMANSDFQIEQDKNGNLIIMSATGFNSGYFEGRVIIALGIWQEESKLGTVLSSSTGFKLPDGSTHAPDASWISVDKVNKLTPEQRKIFAPVVSDFIVEIRSESDPLIRLKRKMTQVWIKNGVRLAWLIDPNNQKTYIYRQDHSTETIVGFDKTLSGENVCEGFKFDLSLLKV